MMSSRQKNLIVRILVCSACVLFGTGLALIWRRPRQTTSTPASATACNIGPLYYQVQKSVSDEQGQTDGYPTKDRYYGKPAPVDFTTSPKAKEFLTRLTEGESRGPNAAGHYTVVQIGWTGNGYFTYVVDARDGKIIVGGQVENSRWRYSIDSDLIVADGIANPAYFHGPSAEPIGAFGIESRLLLLRDGALKEVGSLPWVFGDQTQSSGTIAGPKDEPPAESQQLPYRSIFARDDAAAWRDVSASGYHVSVPYSPRWTVGGIGMSVYDDNDNTSGAIAFGKPTDDGNSIGREYFLSREVKGPAFGNINIDSFPWCGDGRQFAEKVEVGKIQGYKYFEGGAKWCSLSFAFAVGKHVYYLRHNVDIGQSPPENIDSEMHKIIEGIRE